MRTRHRKHLRNAAARLAAELEDVDLFQASAYASMVVDATDQHGGGAKDRGPDVRTDVELDFELDQHGRVWMAARATASLLAGRTPSARRCGSS